MAEEANPTLIGAFIAGAIALLLGAVFIFSNANWGKPSQHYVIHFNESLNGLSIGAPVKLKGVQIGEVTDIQVEYSPNKAEVSTPVYIEVHTEKIVRTAGSPENADIEKEIEYLIEKGMRMQLQLTSFVTGQFFIEAKMMPGTPINLSGRKHEHGLVELPSVPSTQAQFSGVLGEIENMPVQAVIKDAFAVVNKIRGFLDSPEVALGLSNIGSILSGLDKTMSAVGPRIDPIMADLQKTTKSANHVMASVGHDIDPLMSQAKNNLTKLNDSLELMQKTLSDLNTGIKDNPDTIKNINTLMLNAGQTLDPNKQTIQNLNSTLKDVSRLTYSLRVLSDYLSKHPEALLVGKEGED
jgi:paraquat-inducible protein B